MNDIKNKYSLIEILQKLENEYNINFWLNQSYSIINKQVYFIKNNKVILNPKPIYVGESFTELEKWIPSDDEVYKYRYSNFTLEMTSIKLKKIKQKFWTINVLIYV
ncbi:hypothetical protein [Spiroplasma endosymbiont of Labia minor]|uniref:hypothetical protein n=1 Tax=Spiroplasma endosymbiont of Labia minor TaxID=3066305 RepID=UPI0030CD94EB